MGTIRLLIGIGLFSFSLCSSALAFSGFGYEIDGYIKESAQRYQVSEAMLRGLIKMEDGWYGKVSPSGATGIGQFTVKTWNWLAQKPEGKAIGMKAITSKTKGTSADPRRNKRINTLATGLLARWHIEQFAERQIMPTDANLYMAHNIGLEGLHRAMQGRSTQEDIENMRKNGMKRWMNPTDFIAYQKGRYYQQWQLANTMHHHIASISSPVKWIEPTSVNRIKWVNPL
ncbi:transglycosylase SLT domain-containing protein [Avibacterium sp. 21-599]|uniref:transglycosylase SLT domain-containing protein n=1 Tax=Avibacterium sp. 21-599 TaxID=2911528 RepID=UPI0022454CB2|nr:transglycosylase SLT domain-containing protein [Avibacterium sp. 21-599]MCW9718557.1 hypothetical protein [Avibacterium sp. 21-599]